MKTPLLVATALLASHAAAQTPSSTRYVSLGSSYAAGPGVGVPDPASGACGRSMSNYARQLAASHHLGLVDVSCSGAVTENILSEGQHGFPAQIEAVTADTRLVTILIGGNDIDYVGDLLRLACRDSGTANCPAVDLGRMGEQLAALPAKLDAVITEVRRRAPGARIVLVGYLPVVPAEGDERCAALPLTPPDLQRMRDVAARLALAIEGAASRNHIDVVRASQIGAGHDVCSATPFMTGIVPPRVPGWPTPFPYHPNQAGMNAVASALDAVISREARY